MLELADYAPLPLREPVRSLVWIRGRLHQVPPSEVREMLDLIAAEHPHPALLQVQTPESRPVADGDTQYLLARLEIESVVVTDATGAEAVDSAALLAARPDPFCASNHAGSATWTPLTATWSRGWRPGCRPGCGAGDVRPLGIDRYGMRLRVESAEGDRDIRLPFRAPVDDVIGLGKAIRVLLGCPFGQGVSGLAAVLSGRAAGYRVGVTAPH